MIGPLLEPDECHERCSADRERYVVRGNRKRAEKPCCIMMGPGVVSGRYQGLRLIDEAQAAMKLAGIPFDEDMLDGRSFF